MAKGQSLRNPYTGIISIFFNRARQGLHIPVYEDGLESRDFVHVSDVVAALESALKTALPNGLIMNVGAGVPTSVSHLTATLLKVSRYGGACSGDGAVPAWGHPPLLRRFDPDEKYLGSVPRISLEDGLRRFCQWAATQPVHKDRSETSGSRAEGTRTDQLMIRLSQLLDEDWARLGVLAGTAHRQRRLWHSFNFRFAPVVLVRSAQCLYAAGWKRFAKLPALVN